MCHFKKLKMKNRNILRLSMVFITSLAFIGCSDQFLQDKEDFNKTTKKLYDNLTSATSRVDNLYTLLLPSSGRSVAWDSPSTGSSDDFSKCTEEYAGFSQMIDPGIILTTTNVNDYFFNEQKTSRNPYGHIRNCNEVIEGLMAGSLPLKDKTPLLGQAYFFRAWAYLRLVKIYGGVPIVDKVQTVIVGDNEGANLTIPRSKAKDCIEFICEDLRMAAEYLPNRWNGENYGRVTAGAALALQGRARLLYASPLFNRSDEISRWEDAYKSNKMAIDSLKAGGFGLAYQSNPGINASNWAKMFNEIQSPEAVFITLYNNIKQSGSTALAKNNLWENSIRPSNTNGGGGKVPTATMIDLFPMADGKKPEKSSYIYNENTPFMLNRDPRFYRTFGFTGTRWAFSGDPTSLNAIKYPYKGENYELWNYAWYSKKENLNAVNTSGYGADGFGNDYKGVYIRKRTDDLDVNSSALYTYDLESSRPFELSAAPYIEIRYAEVLLNFAESACGAGYYTEAIQALQAIRERVGYKAADNYGLPSDLNGDRAKLFEAILYERQIELAYEGKRFDDMQRWMLWDGGEGQEILNASWKVTGFGGNTCTYLGVLPFNGQRRIGLELRVADTVEGFIADGTPDKDPLKNSRPAAWNLTTQSQPSAALVEFYKTKLTRKLRQVDTSDKVVSFKPNCYFLGLKANAQSNNVMLLQTIGWDDVMNGGMGTFDPLAN